MDWKEQAKRLTEKIFNLSGSNSANEAQKLIEDALYSAYNRGACNMSKAIIEAQTLADTL